MGSVVKQPAAVVPIARKFLSRIFCSCQLRNQAAACRRPKFEHFLSCELSWLFLPLAMPELRWIAQTARISCISFVLVMRYSCAVRHAKLNFPCRNISSRLTMLWKVFWKTFIATESDAIFCAMSWACGLFLQVMPLQRSCHWPMPNAGCSLQAIQPHPESRQQSIAHECEGCP